MIARQPKVDWHGELFHAWYEEWTSDQRKEFGEPLRLLTEPLAQSSKPVFGFESKFEHLRPHGLNRSFATFIVELQGLGFSHYVVLRRRNLLRQAISVLRGQKTRQWHFPAGGQAPPPSTVHVDTNSITFAGQRGPVLERFESVDRDYQQALDCLDGQNLLQLDFEADIASDPRVAYRKTCQFLGLKPGRIQPDLQRIGGQPLASIIENFDEVESVLAGSRFAWMLND